VTSGDAHPDSRNAEAEFEQFFLANHDAVVRVLTLTTGDRERAVDATQEAFIKAHANWATVRTYDAPAAWVRRIAINSCHDLIRSDQRRQHRERTHVDTTAPSPDDAIVSDAFATALIEQLPQRQREVAALFYVDDRSIADIAAILGITDGTVKSSLADARERLRNVLQSADSPPEPDLERR
jgi:RNA polymerase sigma-70 factor, ECF subfamily